MISTPGSNLIATLDDGLTLRRATPTDTDALVAFHAGVHRENEQSEPAPFIAAWVRDLMSGRHPTFAPGDFTIVEIATGEIVSTLSLISQTWSYGGIPIAVGRIELVSTRLDYRRRGLVRRQMDMVHAWSAARGELLQGITGIPHFYRQFGYEMALDLGGGRAGDRSHIPALGPEESEPFHLRAATAADVALIESLDTQGRQRWLVSGVRDAAHWRYEIEGAAEPRYAVTVAVITDHADQAIGYLAHYGELDDRRLIVIACELAPGQSWLAVMPSVLRALSARGDEFAEAHGSGPLRELYFSLGGDHPIYHVLPAKLARVNRPYAWYLRVPDLPVFLRHVAPVLEARLAGSVASGHTGELLLNFFSAGLRLELTNGRLTTIEQWTPPDHDSGGASFPGQSVLQMMFGYRSLAELEHAFAECQVPGNDTRVLLDVLFPRQPSRVWAID
jgi:hypothetical protein